MCAIKLYEALQPKYTLDTRIGENAQINVQVPTWNINFYGNFTGNYEVLPTEPLHDVKEHICNVLTELPAHLEREESDHFQSIIECTFAGKEKLCGCDYRLAAVIVAQYLRGKAN